MAVIMFVAGYVSPFLCYIAFKSQYYSCLLSFFFLSVMVLKLKPVSELCEKFIKTQIAEGCRFCKSRFGSKIFNF